MKKIIVSIFVMGLLMSGSMVSVNAFEKGEQLPGQLQPAKPPKPYADIYVDDDALPGGNGSYEHPFQFIQDGINVASSGDIIYVFDGIYNEDLEIAKSVVLRGEDRDTTVIEGTVLIKTSYMTLERFTIANIKDDEWFHGIWLKGGARNVIKDNRITNLSREGLQTGILLMWSLTFFGS